MRLHATRESVQKGEITLLAVMETVLAVSASAGFAIYTGTVTHIVIGACVAPFLLLRTEQATAYGIRWADRLITTVVREGARVLDLFPAPSNAFVIVVLGPWVAVAALVGMMVMALGLTAIRCLSVLAAFLRSPVRSLRSIPANWLRMNLAMDVLYPPEVVAGIETHRALPSAVEGVRFTRYLSDLLPQSDQPFEFLVDLLVAVCGAVVLYVPALLYRFSLKATSLVYLPLIWVITIRWAPTLPMCTRSWRT